jgi:hypothetical protein
MLPTFLLFIICFYIEQTGVRKIVLHWLIFDDAGDAGDVI